MHLNILQEVLKKYPIAEDLYNFLFQIETDVELTDCEFYLNFPIYNNLEGQVFTTDILLISPKYGVIVVGLFNDSVENDHNNLSKVEMKSNKIFSFIYSKLLRNDLLRSSRTDLIFPTEIFLFAPLIKNLNFQSTSDIEIYNSIDGVQSFFTTRNDSSSRLSESLFLELKSTIEGAKGIIRLKERQFSDGKTNYKGRLANLTESQIANFDQKQKDGFMPILDGLQRIRGLAGSGKTVVLAMKAALMHLLYPDARILYTFYTRSLYQHIKRMITRFYRQFDDRDPDWDKLKIMHAWGGKSQEGVYYNACQFHNMESLTFSSVKFKSNHDPFDFVCNDLLSKTTILPMYDYVLVDEGQDFPDSFIRLCVKLARDSRVVYAYDELQTIFQIKAPSPKDVIGPDIELSSDIVLDKCYRNPREILLCAHALGFGIYGEIRQMLENKEHWEDIGYRVIRGNFQEGDEIIIERPLENSLPIISNEQSKEDIVQCTVFSEFLDEINSICLGIEKDIDDGLRPDDILVIVVDDRNARDYLSAISNKLAEKDIASNNIHIDSYGIKDFQQEGRVTLSTVHKAKGNEAFMVYIVGVDSLFAGEANVRERNILFSAMTRAKGWVRVSGIGRTAEICSQEINKALENFPYLRFEYPSGDELNKIKRDLEEKAIRKQNAERALEKAMKYFSVEEIQEILAQRSINKGES
ncbi:DEAD/DEAH box helicase [Chloroflexota bacterium]|nr:DEAD/DEAH box helicase [Chloroflexota bacterium]